jgi:hypothetical protein
MIEHAGCSTRPHRLVELKVAKAAQKETLKLTLTKRR